VATTCPKCANPAKRETDTMDTFVDSSWYFLRYTSPKETDKAFNPLSVSQWGPVDQYTGGAEHAVMHLLYARFFIKALRDLGLIHFDEPFLRLFNQGIIIADHHKMSKSRGNVITPDLYVGEVGADVIRLYLMFIGPWEYGGDWSDAGMNGIARWVNRIWDLCHHDSNLLNVPLSVNESTTTLQKALHKTIRKVVTDLEKFQFNTAIAALMELTNTMNRIWEQRDVDPNIWESAIANLLLLLAPLAPHVSEELWEKTGRPYSIHNHLLPEWDAQLATDDEFTLVIQVNGKVRDRIQVSVEISEEQVKAMALLSKNVQRFLQSGQVIHQVYVPGRLVNFVVR
jgi:leucyl-tRNA synthetase